MNQDLHALLLENKPELAKNQLNFFMKDYEIKVRYLSDQFSRMWTRFNFFLTVESGLLGGKIIIGGKTKFDSEISLVLLFISLVWYVFGSQDRFLVGLYREQLKSAAEHLTGFLDIGKTYEFAGQPRDKLMIKNFDEWYIKPISITRLAAILPFLLIWVWLGFVMVYYW